MPTVFYLYFQTFHSLIEQQCRGLQGQPVVVVRQHRIIDVSSEAAKLGVSKHESLREARLACSNLVVITAQRDYGVYSQAVWDICTNFTPIIEPIAEDAAFLDLTGCREPIETAKKLICQIRCQTNLPAVISIGASKLVAKAASLLPPYAKQLVGYRKARDILFIPPQATVDFLHKLPIEYLWRLPPTVIEELTSLGCQTLGDLAEIPLLQLQMKFGREAKRLADLAAGIDEDSVQPIYPEQCFVDSYTCPPEVECIDQVAEMHTVLNKCAEKLFQKLLENDVACTKIALHLEFPDGNTAKAQKRLPEPVEQLPRLTRELIQLWQQMPPKPWSAVKVQIGGLTPRAKEQLSLYTQKQQQTQNLEKALTYLTEKLGPSTIKPASAMEIPRREKMLNIIEQNIL